VNPIKRKIQSNAAHSSLNAMSVVVFALLLLTTFRGIGFGVAALTLAGVAWRAWHVTDTQTIPAQLVLTCALLADWQQHTSRHSTVPLIVVGVAIMMLVVSFPAIRSIINRPRLRVANLPGFRPSPDALISPTVLQAATMGVIALLGVSAAVHVPIWPVFGSSLLALVAAGAVGLRGFRVRLRGEADTERFVAALEAYDPHFVLYFSAPDKTEYQVAMWLPYLERIGERFVIIIRERHSLAPLARVSSAPVLYCPSVAMVDRAVTDAMKACFYVNNGAKNSHMVRFNHMTHIQLLHGDSDKASSANQVTKMFDRIFVAGQAGIDRYAAAGVTIPGDKFDIVGRPQVETLTVESGPIAGAPNNDAAKKTVLYATTWIGLYNDANYCSLPIGERIIAELLRRQCRVILRPHPYTHKSVECSRQVARLEQMLADDRAKTGRAHVFGAAATTGMSLFDCINAADALISDISSVASDWLYTAKPFALTNTLANERAEFERAYPLARAAYVIDAAASNIAAVADDLLRDDPMVAIRRQVRVYYLGDFDEASYSDGFVSQARYYVETGPAGVFGARATEVETPAEVETVAPTEAPAEISVG
jgi:CDP-Glycerol:Poly(glycerophosphate) glycerophosphotransferase